MSHFLRSRWGLCIFGSNLYGGAVPAKGTPSGHPVQHPLLVMRVLTAWFRYAQFLHGMIAVSLFSLQLIGNQGGDTWR